MWMCFFNECLCTRQVMLKILELVYDIKPELHKNYRIEA